MWENCFYIGGDDDGVIATGEHRIGAAVCWELMRTQTARRLRSRVDLVMTGSGWWSVPPWPPRALFDRWEQQNSATARAVAPAFAKYVGAPVVHAAHTGKLTCATPWLPMRYQGRFEGSTMITDARGNILAERGPDDGPGVVLAEIEIGRTPPLSDPPDRYWLPSVVWHYQRWHGRRWYQRHVARA